MTEEGPGSVTDWIAKLKVGDSLAAQPIWERYFQRLVRVARDKLGRARNARAAADEEDVALSAFWSFCAGVKEDRFPRLEDRNDLWRLLMHITVCKAVDQIERDAARKRGGGAVAYASDLDAGGEEGNGPLLERIVGREPSPEFAAMLAEEYQRLLDRLGDPTLGEIARLKLSGHTNEEIRERLGCSLRTVTLRLELIRETWRSELEPGR